MSTARSPYATPHARAATRRRRALIALAAIALLWPLPLLALVDKPGIDSAGTIAAAVLGFVALNALVVQVVGIGRTRRITQPFGLLGLVRVHRLLGVTAVALAVLHVVVLLVDDPDRLALLDVPDAPLRARMALLSLTALLVILATSLWRRHVRLSYEAWRGLHLTLAVVAIIAAAIHTLEWAQYASSPVIRWGVVAMTAIAALALFQLRAWRQFTAARRRWVLREVRPERGDCTTLVLEADGHDGTPFRPGQFAWIKLADRPYSVAEHPFSYASAATRADRVEFTIRHLGDFTSSVRDLAPGTQLLVDGPHGTAREADPAAGWVLVTGGAGITPAMSLLRTLAELDDGRPVLLVHGSRSWEEITFREELEALHRRPGIDVVHVLGTPPPGWTGETGHVDAETLARVLPPDGARRNWFLCGPPPMVDGVERALDELGVPPTQRHVELFDTA